MSEDTQENEFEEIQFEFNAMECIKFLLLALMQGVGLEHPHEDGWDLLRSWKKNFGTESPVQGKSYEEGVLYFKTLASKAGEAQNKAGLFWYGMYEMYQFYGGMEAAGGGHRWFEIDGNCIGHRTTWMNQTLNWEEDRLNTRLCVRCNELITDEDFEKDLVGYYNRINALGWRFGYQTYHKRCDSDNQETK